MYRPGRRTRSKISSNHATIPKIYHAAGGATTMAEDLGDLGDLGGLGIRATETILKGLLPYRIFRVVEVQSP